MGNFGSSNDPLVTNETFPFISDQLDEFFSSLGVPFFKILAVTAIALGFVIAFLGPKGQGPKLVGFIAGALIGCFLGAVLLEAIDDNLDNTTWVSLFFLCGFIVGLLCSLIMTFARVVLGIAMGLSVMGIILQTGLGDAIGNNYVILGLVVVSCIVGIFIACIVIDLIYAILSAVLGGVFLILGIGYFTNSEITINGLVADPKEVAKCDENRCIIPLAIGTTVTVVALIYNIIGFRRLNRKKRKAQEAMAQSDDLVKEMKAQREAFENRLKDLESKNLALMKEMDSKAEARESIYLQNIAGKLDEKNAAHNEQLMKIQKQLEEQQKRTLEATERAAKQQEALRMEMENLQNMQKENDAQATLQRIEEMNALNEKLKIVEKEKEALLTELEGEKSELQLEIEKEKLLQSQREAELAREEQLEKKQKEKEMQEEDANRRAMLLSLQQEIAENKLKIQDFEEEFKETTKLEKRLKLKLPPMMQKRKDSFIFSDIKFNKEEVQTEEFAEMKVRAEEFTKLKQVVTKTKAGQRTALKNLKKAVYDVERLGNQLRTFSKKNVLSEEQEVVRKEKEQGLEEMTVKMTTLRSLLEKYEAINNSFIQLISDMEESLKEFRRAEKRIEAYTDLNEEEIENLPQATALAVSESQINLLGNTENQAQNENEVQIEIGAENLVDNFDEDDQREDDIEENRRNSLRSAANVGRNVTGNDVVVGNVVPVRRPNPDNFLEDDELDRMRPSHQDLNDELIKYIKFKTRQILSRFRKTFGRD